MDADAAHPAASLFLRRIAEAVRDGGMRVDVCGYFYDRPADSLPRVTSGGWLRRAAW